MNPTQRTYIAIDLKSFFASVECVERGLDPLTTNLVVADASRTEKTICLAVTPSLKTYGIGGRARLFEVVQRVREVNRQRWYRSFHTACPVSPAMPERWSSIPTGRWTTSWPRPGWPTTSNTAGGSMRFT